MAGTGGNARSGAPLLSSALGGRLVTVEVGPERKVYNVHQPLLTHHSEYFRNALRGPWKEASEGVVPLSDIEPMIFDIFVEWLYTRTLPVSLNEWLRRINLVSENWYTGEDIAELNMVLLKAYAFGDRFIAPTFRSSVMESLVLHMLLPVKGATSDFMAVIRHAYDSTPAHSVVLQLLVDTLCQYWCSNEDTSEDMLALRNIPIAFTHRALRRFSEIGVTDKAAKEARETKEKAEAIVKQRSHEWKKAEQDMLQANKALRVRCYTEHLTAEERTECSRNSLHMRYDEDADYGYFE